MTGDDSLDLLVEGETHDHTVHESPYGTGEEPAPFHQRALGIADVGGHIVRRTVTVGKDEVLCLDDHGNLSVAGVEYTVVKSAGDYHCSCGATFDGPGAAYDHLESMERKR